MLQHLFERKILAAQDIFLADPPAFGGLQMALSDILDAREIESGFDKRRHPAIEKINDYAACRRRFVIERTDRRRWIYNHNGQALARGLDCYLLGEKFRSLVRTDHIFERDGRVLATNLVRTDAERPNRAGVNDLPDARAPRSFEQVARAVNISRVHRRLIFHPQAIIGGHVIDLVTSAHRT